MCHHAFHMCLYGLALVFITGCGSPRGEALHSPKGARGSPAIGASSAPLSQRISRPTPERIAAAHARFASAVILEMNGEGEAALEEYWKAAQDDPDSEWLALEVSRRLIHQRKLERAQQLLERAAARPDASSSVVARLAMVYSQLGKHDLAIQASRASIQKNPSSLGSYQGLFFNFLHAGRTAEALKTLDSAAAVRNPSVEFLLGLAELYASYTMQHPSEREAVKPKALALLHRAQKMDMTDPGYRLKLADGLATFGETEPAAAIYQELLSEDVRNPMLREAVHAKLANIYLRGSDRKRARAQLEALMMSNPTNPQPYFFLGQLAVEEKNLEEAVEQFSKALLLNEGFEGVYYELANAQLGLDKPNEALATIEKARKRFPANYFMEFATGIAHSRLKDFDLALKHFTAAEVMGNASEPKRVNHFLYFQLGVAYEQKGEYDEAARAFEKCLELAPDFDEAMNYLGYMWADRGENLDKALELLLKAVKMEPENAAYLDSLGWVYFRLGRFPEAQKYIQKAVDLSEEPDAVLHEHLGDVFHALGDGQRAREEWTKAQELEPKDSVREKLEGAGRSSEKPQ
jgi:tetratricopeptide (TPR) repeat protein